MNIMALVSAIFLGMGMYSGTGTMDVAINVDVTVAVVNGEKLEMEVYQEYLNAIKKPLERSVGAESVPDFWQTEQIEGESVAAFAKRTALDEAIRRILIIQMVSDEGIVLSDADKAEIEQIKAQTIAEFADRAEYEKTLAEEGWTDAFYDRLLNGMKYEQLLSNKIISEITEEQMLAYYNDSMVRVKHILILHTTVDEAGDDAATIANQLHERAMAGEDFDALIAEYSDDPGSGFYPEGYVFGEYGNYVKSFLNTALALQVDEVSGVVESTYGYHIIKRYPHVGDEGLYLSNIETIQEEMFSARVEEKKAASSIEIWQDEIDKIVM